MSDTPDAREDKSPKSARGIAYTAGQAAQLVGVSATTVRTWERQGLVEGRRSKSGYRYFSEADIQRLREVAHLRKLGLNAPGIKRALIDNGELPPQSSVPLEVPLGSRLRRLRQAEGLTLEQAAKRAGLSGSFLSSLERDQTGVGPAALQRLVHSYGITVSSLTRTDGDSPLMQHKRPGDRRIVRSHGLAMEQLVDGHTLLDAYITDLAPETTSDGTWSHEGEELILVLEGELSVTVGSERFRLRPGESLYHPSTLPHRWDNLGETMVRALWVGTPPTF